MWNPYAYILMARFLGLTFLRPMWLWLTHLLVALLWVVLWHTGSALATDAPTAPITTTEKWGVGLAFSLGMALWIGGLAYFSRWSARFSLHELIFIALSSALLLLLVALPGAGLSLIAGVLLGPFSFLLSGLWFKLLWFAIVGSLMALVPRVGVFFCFYLLWRLTQSLIQGHHSWLAWGGGGLLVLGIEATLWAVGLTAHHTNHASPPALPINFQALQNSPTKWKTFTQVMWPALAVGITEGAVLWLQLASFRWFYHLYLPQWYQLIQISASVLYAAMGMGLGLAMGQRLQLLKRQRAHFISPGALDASIPVVQSILVCNQIKPINAPPCDANSSQIPYQAPCQVPLLELFDLHYQYAATSGLLFEALHLKLYPSELVWLRGESGSGKSTLLRLIKGLLPCPPQAVLRWHEKAITPHTEQADWILACALLLQHPINQAIRSTPRQEIALGLHQKALRLHQKTPGLSQQHQPAHPLADSQPPSTGFNPAAFNVATETKMEMETKNLLQQFALTAVANVDLHTLSSGQQQRALLAAMVAMQPELCLLDEPFAHQDPLNQARCLHALEALAASGSTVLIADHQITHRLADQAENAPSHRSILLPSPQKIAGTPLPPKSTPSPSSTASLQPLQINALSYVHPRHRKQDAGDEWLLKNMNAAVRWGSWITIQGENGVGKTTLLELMAGWRAPSHKTSHGQVVWQGHPLHRQPAAAKRKVCGYLPQPASLLFRALSVTEELQDALQQQVHNAAHPVHTWLSWLGLESVATTYPWLLSKGQQQLLGLALVLINAPHVLLLDEPFAGMDFALQQRASQLIENWMSEEANRAVVIATHHAIDCASEYGNPELSNTAVQQWTLKDGHLRTA